MLAILAFVCFLLATFDVSLGELRLVPLGLALLTLDILFPFRPWTGSRWGVSRGP